MKVTLPDGTIYAPLSSQQPHIILMEYPDGKRVAFAGNLDEENTWRYLSKEQVLIVMEFLDGNILATATVLTDDDDGDEDI